jgi:hypothetical protein
VHIKKFCENSDRKQKKKEKKGFLTIKGFVNFKISPVVKKTTNIWGDKKYFYCYLSPPLLLAILGSVIRCIGLYGLCIGKSQGLCYKYLKTLYQTGTNCREQTL